MYATDITILRTHERVTAMTCLDPLLPSFVLSKCTRKMEESYWITVRVYFPGLRVTGIIFASTKSTSFRCDHFLRTCGTWLTTDVRTFAVCLHQKPRDTTRAIYRRKGELCETEKLLENQDLRPEITKTKIRKSNPSKL